MLDQLLEPAAIAVMVHLHLVCCSLDEICSERHLALAIGYLWARVDSCCYPNLKQEDFAMKYLLLGWIKVHVTLSLRPSTFAMSDG